MLLKRKEFIILLSTILLICGVSVTISFLQLSSQKTNDFEKGIVTNTITETFENNVKTDVSVKNTGNVTSYIRASIIISYKNSEDVVLSEEPIANTDYKLELSSSQNWLYSQDDGYYYYKLPVDANVSTDVLINRCTELNPKTGQTFNVDIVSQTIQATPKEAVEEAWPVTIDNNDNIVLGN